MREGVIRIGGKRIDKKHRFVLRTQEATFKELAALAFRHEISQNLILNEMISFALASNEFNTMINSKYITDDRQGHYVYIRRSGF